MSFFFNGFPFGMGGDDFGGFGGGRPKKEEPKEVDNSKYYEILGVSKTASYEEIRKAYRKLAKTKHPDKGGSEQEFQELQQAYEVLSDENKRKIYDKYGEEGIKEGRGDGPEGMDLNDLFFGGGARRRGKRRTKSVLQNFDVTLEDIYLGKEKIFEISHYRICKNCKGSGSKNPDANTKCPGCDGRGYKVVIQRLPMGMIQTQRQCDECNGEGTVIKDKDRCPNCKGNKVVKESKMIKIMLDKGAPDGKRYTFKGEADEMPDYEPGDVVVEINIKKHNKFIRKGADLLYKADITLLEALTGFEMVITHLDGREILVKTKPGQIIRPGILKTVEDCGMPFFEAPNRFGNLFIDFNIIFPDAIDENQTKELKAILGPGKMDVEIDKSIKESYTMSEFKESEQNTNAAGGTGRRRGAQYEEDDDEDSGRPRGARCEAQ
ncbi:MAG: DnaJ domain-containing protein [archaeon]|nr:DnaJ domain-containing protein [archaeon]